MLEDAGAHMRMCRDSSATCSRGRSDDASSCSIPTTRARVSRERGRAISPALAGAAAEILTKSSPVNVCGAIAVAQLGATGVSVASTNLCIYRSGYARGYDIARQQYTTSIFQFVFEVRIRARRRHATNANLSRTGGTRQRCPLVIRWHMDGRYTLYVK